MLRPTWPKLSASEPSPGNVLGQVARAAVAGEALWAILDVGARGLLAVGEGDRAGIWLAPFAPDDSSAPWQGVVAESPGMISTERKTARLPEEWRQLDPSSGFLYALVQAHGTPSSGAETAAGLTGVAQLAGMQSVVWLPLRVRGCAVGLAMLA